MSNNIYDILKKMAGLEQPKTKKLNEGVYDIDNRSIGGDDNEIDRLEAAIKDPNHPERAFLMGKYGINKKSDLTKLPSIRNTAEKGYTDKRTQRDVDQAEKNRLSDEEDERDLERMRKFGGAPGMNESKKKAKPDYLDMDKDGDKKEPMKKAVKDKEKGAIAEAVAIVESALMEKYMGFKKTVAAIKKGGSADDPEAVAASIGRKKYGKEKFQKAAAAGKKLGEDHFDENFSKDETDSAVRDFMSKGGRAEQLPMKKPRKSEKTDFASKHIGGRGEVTHGKAKRVGKRANTNPTGKPVVTAEDDMGEGNEFSGALARARAQGKDSFEVDGKTYKVDEAKHFRTAYGWAVGRNEKTGKTYKHPDQIKADRDAKKTQKTKEQGVKEGWDDMQAYLKKKNKDTDSKGGSGVKAGKRYGGAAQKDDDSDTDTQADTQKTRGRPKKDKFAR